nr:hypothetical protein [uncultured Mediterranean phage uvMED]BAR26440.1 hypothetical protein [uncultured Mediterranean phage uvMED]|tara:strand:+ start:990 stop:1223 length:234 start_codon:yes stop_codon:yes gene_type:complete
MTVNVTEQKNTVTVNGITRVITVKTQGTQGANFSSLNKSMVDTNVADGSIPYYDAASGTYRADQTTTKLTLVDGGNF